MADSEEHAAVVIDAGSSLCRAGFSGDDTPKVTFPTLIGRPSDEDSGECKIGKDAIQTELIVSEPMQRGVVKNWDDLELIYKSAFEQLGVKSEEHSILITERMKNSGTQKEKLGELLFEKFNVPAMNISDPCYLAQMAAGRGTAISVDMGHGVISAKVVYEGYIISEAIQRIDVGGQNITSYLMELLEPRGYKFETFADEYAVQKMKEELCFASLDFEADTAKAADLQKSFTLPNGQSIVLGTERFSCVEPLFNLEMIGMDPIGIHDIIHKSVTACDYSVRRDVCCNVVISGGCSKIPSFPARLKLELEKLFPSSMKINVVANENRELYAWIGGSMYSALSSFPNFCVSKCEYEEQGAKILSEKFK